MKIILMQDVAHVGRKFNTVEVANGYGRNFLIPRGLAILADTADAKSVESMKAVYEATAAKREAEIADNIAKLAELDVTISAKANEEGHLYAGITADQVVAELGTQHGVTLDASMVNLEAPIKEAGEHTVAIVRDDQQASLKVTVTATQE